MFQGLNEYSSRTVPGTTKVIISIIITLGTLSPGPGLRPGRKEVGILGWKAGPFPWSEGGSAGQQSPQSQHS